MDEILLKNLFREVNRIIEHNKEIERIKGEKFNIFSILKMERAENNTHSAFLSELLNPKGSHLMGNLFLKLFLESINDHTVELLTAKVKTEHSIGHRDDIKKTGGRIDIYIWDDNGNSISIENKIYAGDQNAQIERYCNHNKEKNSVYYLTREGTDPSISSRGDLVSAKDFKLLSYKTDILSWLNLCVKECVNQPILRESINQYIILIKKITNTMDNKEQRELEKIILSNYEVSSFVASNFEKAAQNLKEKFRCDVINLLKVEIGDKYLIESGSPASFTNSQIWIKPISIHNSHLCFGIESFSGKNHFNTLIIGIFNKNAPTKTGYSEIEGVDSYSNWWLNVKYFEDFQNKKIYLGSSETISLIYSDLDFRKGLLNDIVRQVKEYLDIEVERLINFINTNP